MVRVLALAAGVIAVGVGVPQAASSGADTSDPDSWITSGPQVMTTQTGATFTFTASEAGVSFKCALDGAAFTACSSPKSYSGLAKGRHRFFVKATDAAGNADTSPALYTSAVGLTYPWKTPAGRVRPWAQQFMGAAGVPTQSEAVADAKNFMMIFAHPKAYKSYVAAMKQANPKLLLVVYMNTTTTYRTDLPESAYAHDANGRRITPLLWTDTYLMEPSSPYMRAFKKSEATQRLAESGYDGLFLDAAGTAALKTNYVSSPPVNPATGKLYTPAEWLAAVGAVVDGVKSVVLPRPIMMNSLKDGRAYFDPVNPRSDTLGPGITGSEAETWLRESEAAITSYPSESTWKQNVDMIRDAEAKGYAVLQCTKVWTNATVAQKDAWYKYALASWLLGNQGRSFFFFTYKNGDSTIDRALAHLDLGTPSGAYTKANGVYQRTFSAGKVLVNPTSSTATVPLGATYKKLNGTTATSATLRPNTAEILKTP
jgi:hypothetical protein